MENVHKFPEVKLYWDAAAQSRLDAYDRTTLEQHPDLLMTSRHKIRAEIASLRGLAASFESRLNDISPIHMLPNDVLAHCFDILTTVDPLDRFRDYMDHQMGLIFENSNRKSLGKRLRWINATHVCRRWRNVALDHATLWRKPALHLGLQWFTTMIQRARHSPLHIHDLSDSYATATQGPDVFHDIITNTVRQQISRIQELGLVTYIPPPESDQTPFLLSLTTAAPMLKSLKIQTQYQPGRDIIDLPSDFLGGHFPLLQRIDLTLLATNSWTMLSSGSLVYFHINLCAPHSSYDPLLDLFAANPGLQDVSLCNCLPAHSVPYRGREAIKLPSLKALRLKGWDSTCANILQALRMPATADLILNEIESSRDQFSSLFAEFKAHFARGSTEDFRHLHTTCSSSRFEVHLTTHLKTKGVSSLDPSHSYSFTFSTAFIPDVTSTAVICRAFDKLPVANVQTLSLRNAAIRPLWIDGLARLPHIKSITIEDELRTNQPSILFESGQHGLVHYFPELKELEIVKTNLCDRYPYPDWKCSQAALLSLMIRRSEFQPAASQLERLRLLDCTVSFDNIWRLEAVVPIVEANGGRKGAYFDGKANKKGKRT